MSQYTQNSRCHRNFQNSTLKEGLELTGVLLLELRTNACFHEFLEMWSAKEMGLDLSYLFDIVVITEELFCP